WELLLGATLSLTIINTSHKARLDKLLGKRIIAEALSACGLLLLLLSFFVLNSKKLFPGAWALLPTVGTLLLLTAGPSAFVNRIFLSWRPMVWVGLISYPLYLWHWPLLAFLRIEFLDPTVKQKAGI